MKLLNAMSCWLYLLASLLLLVNFANASLVDGDHVVTTNDADGDRIVDTVDVDDDNDGIPDVEEISGNGLDVDTDRDGVPNRLDLDSDNDGILDWQESGAVITVDFSAMRVVSGRILGEVGANGFIDDLETLIDNGQMRYTLVNTDSPEDDLPDMLDLDSDNDGLTDLREAGVDASYDADNDARIDIDNVNGSAGIDGIPNRLQISDDKFCCDVNGDGIEDIVPRNSDGADLPDFQDLDSDNDGVTDLLESGGGDFDRDGRVDNFFDSPVLDGMDDTILLIPFEAPDSNGNAVPDFIDQFAQSGAVDLPEQPTNAATTQTLGTDLPVEVEPLLDVPASSDDGIIPGEDFIAMPANTENGIVAGEYLLDQSGGHGNAEPAVNSDPVNSGLPPDEGTEFDVIVDRDPVARPGGEILPEFDSPPAEDDSSTGFVRTGLNASGCSVESTGIDLIVLLLSVFSVATLGWRYTIQRVKFRSFLR